jgi:hypothetical protein
MIMKLDGWDRFGDASFWWLDLMVVVWVLFALMVYILEPLVIHRLFHDFALRQKHRAFAAGHATSYRRAMCIGFCSRCWGPWRAWRPAVT